MDKAPSRKVRPTVRLQTVGLSFLGLDVNSCLGVTLGNTITTHFVLQTLLLVLIFSSSVQQTRRSLTPVQAVEQSFLCNLIISSALVGPSSQAFLCFGFTLHLARSDCRHASQVDLRGAPSIFNRSSSSQRYLVPAAFPRAIFGGQLVLFWGQSAHIALLTNQSQQNRTERPCSLVAILHLHQLDGQEHRAALLFRQEGLSRQGS